MATIVLTVHEETEGRARERIASLAAGADAVELRVDAFSRPGDAVDFTAFRDLTSRPLLLTRRGSPLDPGEAGRALEAGFDLLDVELREPFDPDSFAPFRSRAVLSLHDFTSIPSDLEAVAARMAATGAAHVKIAATPRSLDENFRLLRLLGAAQHLSVIGMGDRGLYTRALAPFFGSALAFVSAANESAAAPGQFDLARGRAIWGDGPTLADRDAIFAVVGNPVAHSLSPLIHNRRFRELGLRAAYAAIEVDRFDEAGEALADARPFAPRGLSITAPFKEAAFRFAVARGATLTRRAEVCEAINTLVRLPDGALLGDNTDVDGVAAALETATNGSLRAGVIGSGGGARSAVLALRQRGYGITVYARSPEKAEDLAEHFGVEVRPIAAMKEFDGSVLVNSASADASIPYPSRVLESGALVIDLAYSPERIAQLDDASRAGARTFGGRAFLDAQAEAQSELFQLALGGGSQ